MYFFSFIGSVLWVVGPAAGVPPMSWSGTTRAAWRFAVTVRFVVGPDELARFRAGEDDAVRAVFRAYGGLVLAVALRTLGDRQLAEEAVQETFVKAWRAAASYDPTREVGPWLATIARRTAIDLHRREARRSALSLEDAGADPALVQLPTGVERAYDVWAVREAIDELPADEREVVRLQHLEELSQAEVAERLGIPVGTVKSRSFRAHRHLAARLGHLREVDG
jgi:RNA polymerase sigma-70 factor (ECF subfamily)